MVSLKMKTVAAGCALLSLFGVNVQATLNDVAVPWPQHGSIKLGTSKSPVELHVDLPGCLYVTFDWAKDKVEYRIEGQQNGTSIPGSEVMRPQGGQLVSLMTLEDDAAHIIAYVESTSGSLDTRQISFPISQCMVSKLKVSSPTPAGLENLHVAVSQEIEELYRKAMGLSDTQ